MLRGGALMRRGPLLASKAARARALCSYSERMAKTGRPISPALSIPYRFPLIAISSITVRITGVLLTAGAPRDAEACGSSHAAERVPLLAHAFSPQEPLASHSSRWHAGRMRRPRSRRSSPTRRTRRPPSFPWRSPSPTTSLALPATPCARPPFTPRSRRPLFPRQARAPRAQIWDLTARGFTNQNMLHSSYALFGGAPPPSAPAPRRHPPHAPGPRLALRPRRAGVSGLISLALASYSIASPAEDKAKKA